MVEQSVAPVQPGGEPAPATRVVSGVQLELLAGGQGEPLLLLHDYEYVNAWHPYLAGLAERFTVLAPSHPGFGGSELPPELDSLDDLVYLYLDLLRQLGAERVHLVGAGLGGWIAAELAVRCSHQLDRLVLVDAVGIKVSGPTERDIADTFVLGPREILELTWHDPDLGAERMRLPGLGSFEEDELVRLLRGRRTAALLGWKPFLHNPRLRGRLGRIDRPTLVLWGASDRLVSPAYGQAYAAAIPGARFETIAQAGHYPYLEQPAAFVAAVGRFLEAC